MTTPPTVLRGFGAKSFLREAAFASSTSKAYARGLHSFLDWVVSDGARAPSFGALDDLLSEFFHFLFLSGGSKGLARNAFYGVCVALPRAKSRLPASRLALRGWERLRPAVAHPPLTWELTAVIAVQLARHGTWRMGVGALLAFESYLRVGELVGLRRADFADVGDARLGSVSASMFLRLAKTKTGSNQWVEVRAPVVRALLRRVVAGTGPGGRLFPFSAAQFRRSFGIVCAELSLSPAYVPHSLRHGGATRDHLAGHSIEDILLRGRWVSVKSARRYVQSGRAVLLSLSVPPALVSVSRSVARRLLSIFSLSQLH